MERFSPELDDIFLHTHWASSDG